MGLDLFALVVSGWLACAAIAFVALCFIDAPYGKQTRTGWGPGIPNQLAWCLMEVVVLVSFFTTAVLGGAVWDAPLLLFAGLLTLHYVNRSLVYPFRTRTRGKVMPLSIMLASVGFNTVNGIFLGWDLPRLARGTDWFADHRFILGLVLFAAGMALNWHSDNILLHLRRPGETGYKIPQGGAFRWVTSPNLLGEIIEWTGFAMLTWSLSGLAFAVWTCANLVPRARTNQRWYRQKFPDYPAGRRTLLPGLW